MNLSEKQAFHQALADAYAEGATQIAAAKKATAIDCMRAVERMKAIPGTCRHPGGKLSRTTERLNKFADEAISKIHHDVVHCQSLEKDDNDSEIPF